MNLLIHNITKIKEYINKKNKFHFNVKNKN